jgi:hypothetical protein
MSFSMFARPAPTDRTEPAYFGQLKYRLARKFWDHDGSLRSDKIRVGAELLDYLRGMRDGAGNGELADDAQRLIDLIEANPQGVDVWIGDHDDHD